MNLSVVHVTSELAPIAKEGGLADVVYGLARATVEAGHRVEIWLPKYDQIDLSLLSNLQKKEKNLWSAQLKNLPLLLIDEPPYFHRGQIYGCIDDIQRFSHFATSVITRIQKLQHVDVIHLHDWETALVALLIQNIFPRPRLIFTIHNLEYQGHCQVEEISAISKKQKMEIQDPQEKNTLNLLISGIRFSDFITTVSPTYRQEILTSQGGHGLETILAQYQHKLRGILNGIDYTCWNPESDFHLPYPYAINSLQKKSKNKSFLQQRFQLNQSDSPLIGVVTRLVPQKGLELIEEGIRYILKKGGQFVLIGSTLIEEITLHFQSLQKELQGKKAAFFLDYNESLARLVYAGVDILFVPSLSEPCGLTPMIALRYGTIPIVHATGGLKDIICDWETSKEPPEKRNGFTFTRPDPLQCFQTIDRALNVYRNKPAQWKQLMHQAMTQDFSWKRSLQEYLALYMQKTL